MASTIIITKSRRATGSDRAAASVDDGFSLIEVIVAMSILLVGLLGLARVFYVGLSLVGTSSPSLVAREKAREAIESVHTARDTRTITWAQIRNVNAPGACPAGTTGVGGGRFLNNEQNMRGAGVDGLVNTNDDAVAPLESSPGPDNIMGNADDVPLLGFTREMSICDINGNSDLRQIVVTIRFNGTGAVGNQRREYRLTTFISRFS